MFDEFYRVFLFGPSFVTRVGVTGNPVIVDRIVYPFALVSVSRLSPYSLLYYYVSTGLHYFSYIGVSIVRVVSVSF